MTVKEFTQTEHGFNLKGFTIITASLILLVVGIQQTQVQGITPVIVVVLLAAILLFAIFVLNERRSTHPLIPHSILKQATYIGSSIIAFTANFQFGVLLFLTPLYLQQVLTLSASKTGVVMLAFSIPITLVALATGRIVGILGARRALTVGMLGIAIGFIPLLFISESSDVTRLFVIALLIAGIGQALAYNVSTTTGMESVTQDNAGIASGALSTVRMLGWTLGVAVSGLLLIVFGYQHATGEIAALTAAQKTDFTDAFKGIVAVCGISTLVGATAITMIHSRYQPRSKNH